MKGTSFKQATERGEVVMKSGLICLKGGDLDQEIKDSGTRPKMVEISSIFQEPFF